MYSFDYLLFDQASISSFIGLSKFQSIEYLEGKRLVDHVCGKLGSELLENVIIEYTDSGILFVGKMENDENQWSEKHILCFDLTVCDIMSEMDHPSDLLIIIQKSLRTAVKIWNRQPFSSSERIHETKSIIFPFVMGDRRRLVIERSNSVEFSCKGQIVFPLLAYKYSAEDPKSGQEIANTGILQCAGNDYIEKYAGLQLKHRQREVKSDVNRNPINQYVTSELSKRDDFIFWGFEAQYQNLTENQKSIVDCSDYSAPMRVEGAAGTGKTIALLMRAYKYLEICKKKNMPCKVIFYSHNNSTNSRNKNIFLTYSDGESFLKKQGEQWIAFTTLLDFASQIASIPLSMIENDATDAKTMQLMTIEEAVRQAKEKHIINTYLPLLSHKVHDLFDEKKTEVTILCQILQHEFSIQIKGRTNGTFDSYEQLKSMENGLFCENKKDKELVFELFNIYQNILRERGEYDIDDITIQALALLNAPVWRRERVSQGYDAIFVDEMHLFNINEQSVFHFLTRDNTKKQIPINFALDYCQAVGDRGDTSQDYIEKSFGSGQKTKLNTVFRSSPQIAELCAGIATSGALMFQKGFANPYQNGLITSFTDKEEKMFQRPYVQMFLNEEEMIEGIRSTIDNMMHLLHCKFKDIAIIFFDQKYLESNFINTFNQNSNIKLSLSESTQSNNKTIQVFSPYDVNGLEFHGVILVGVDEGRIPQKFGTGDISQHYIKYSAYNLLYLTMSRARFSLAILGNKLNGVSSCFEHVIASGKIELRE